MSSRGEQFFLDEKRANHVARRAQPRYTLTPSLVLKDDKPFMAIGTPGGDNQEQTILQASSTSWNSGTTGTPTCTRRLPGRAFRRCTSTDR